MVLVTGIMSGIVLIVMVAIIQMSLVGLIVLSMVLLYAMTPVTTVRLFWSGFVILMEGLIVGWPLAVPVRLVRMAHARPTTIGLVSIATEETDFMFGVMLTAHGITSSITIPARVVLLFLNGGVPPTGRLRAALRCAVLVRRA